MHDLYINALPPAWDRRAIGSVGRVVGGSTPSRGVQTFWGGNIPWVTPGELTELRTKYLSRTRESITRAGLAGSSTTVVPKDSLLVTTRATIGSLALAALPMATNQGFKTLIFVGGADPSFYYHCLRRLTPELVRLASGTTFLEIGAGDFGQILLPWPPPPEQRRVAEILDTLDDAIRATEQLIAKLDQMWQGLLHDLLTRGIDESGKVREPTGGGRGRPVLPPTWRREALGALADFKNGYPFAPSDWGKEGLPIIRIAQLTDADAVLDRYSGSLPDDYVARDGDLLFSWSATLMTQIWTREPGYVNQHIFKVTPNTKTCVSFLHHLLDYSMDALAAQSHGTTMRHITGADLLPFRVALPPLVEQKEIAARLDAHRAFIATEALLRTKMTRLRSGLADDLLTGRVRVRAPGGGRA